MRPMNEKELNLYRLRKFIVPGDLIRIRITDRDPRVGCWTSHDVYMGDNNFTTVPTNSLGILLSIVNEGRYGDTTFFVVYTHQRALWFSSGCVEKVME